MTLADIKQLYNEGNKVAGRKALIDYLKNNPTDDSTWAYLGAKCTDLGERKFCYEQALEIADNPTIQARLDKLEDYDSAEPPEFLAVAAKKSRLPVIVGSLLGLGLFCGVCLCVGTLWLFPPEPRRMAVAPTATPAPTLAPTDTPTAMSTATNEPIPTESAPPDPSATPTVAPTLAPTATPTTNWELSAKDMCEILMKRKLQAPDTAKFNHTHFEIVPILRFTQTFTDYTPINPNGLWYVEGDVSSVNGFNARLTSDYVCIIDYDAVKDKAILAKFILKPR